MVYHSQCGQDKWLNETVFMGKKTGTFAEIGAHDGISLSNTYFFEKELGWTGLCVEPIQQQFEKLEDNRSATCVNGCAYNKNGSLTFTKVNGGAEMLSGVKSEYDPRHVKRLTEESKGDTEDIKVPCYTLEKLFDMCGMEDIDYVSIDTEGSELKVLQGINFDKVTIKVIGVENNYPDSFGDITDFLEGKGYKMVKQVGDDCMFMK